MNIEIPTKWDKRKKIVARALEVFIIAALIYCCKGCQTFKGAAQDTAWLLQTAADNIQPQSQP